MWIGFYWGWRLIVGGLARDLLYYMLEASAEASETKSIERTETRAMTPKQRAIELAHKRLAEFERKLAVKLRRDARRDKRLSMARGVIRAYLKEITE